MCPTTRTPKLAFSGDCPMAKPIPITGGHLRPSAKQLSGKKALDYLRAGVLTETRTVPETVKGRRQELHRVNPPPYLARGVLCNKDMNAQMTQTAEQAGAKLIHFPSADACEAFIAEHNLAAIRSCQGSYYIAIFFDARGVFGISSPTTGELLPDW
jgi:hypothetical protein